MHPLNNSTLSDLYRDSFTTSSCHNQYLFDLPGGCTEDDIGREYDQPQYEIPQTSQAHSNGNCVTMNTQPDHYQHSSFPFTSSKVTKTDMTSYNTSRSMANQGVLAHEPSVYPVQHPRSQHTSHTMPVDDSLQLLLPAGQDKSAPLWNKDMQAPQFLVAKHNNGKVAPASGVKGIGDEKSKNVKPATQYLFVPQQPDKTAPAGQQTMIRQTAMKNFLSLHGYDPRKKRPKAIPDRLAATRTKVLPRPPKKGTKANTRAKRRSQQGIVGDSGSATANAYCAPVYDIAVQRSCDHGIVWQGAPNVLYNPVLTTDDMTVYSAGPFREMQLTRSVFDGRSNQFGEWPDFPIEINQAIRLKHDCM